MTDEPELRRRIRVTAYVQRQQVARHEQIVSEDGTRLFLRHMLPNGQILEIAVDLLVDQLVKEEMAE